MYMKTAENLDVFTLDLRAVGRNISVLLSTDNTRDIC